MRAVTIHDLEPDRNVLACDLVHFLRLDTEKVLSSTWICKHVWCTGEYAADLERISEAGTRVTGAELLRLASGISQVIDGDFVATHTGERQPWLVIRAIDSSEYVVVTADDDFLASVKERFRDVRDSPQDAEYPLDA